MEKFIIILIQAGSTAQAFVRCRCRKRGDIILNKADIQPRIFGCKTKAPLGFSVCGQLISPSRFLHHRRSLDENVFIMITEGTLYITANNVDFSLGPGQYIFLKAGEEHIGCRPSEGKLSYLWVHFRADCDFETIHNEDEYHSYIMPETSVLSDLGRTSQLFHQLMDISLEEELYSQNMTDYALSLLMMEITQEYLHKQDHCRRQPAAVIFAKEWIKKHYYHPFCTAELACAAGYQADYLSSLFKRSTGISIVSYTNMIRIKNAKALLTSCDITIKEAAYSCGFPDEKYFMKVFRKLEGVTPTQFKNAFGRKNIN